MMHVILVLNAGSSSVKFAVFAVAGEGLRQVSRGAFDGIGTAPHFSAMDAVGATVASEQFAPEVIASQEDAVQHLAGWLKGHDAGLDLIAVGHRVAHGGLVHGEPVLVDERVLEVLAGFIPLAHAHQPHNLAPIRALAKLCPDVPQVACFDTAFHRTAPLVAELYALPRRFFDAGVRRYGFHGLSYESIVQALAKLDLAAALGRLVVAHLGNGCSMAAIQDGSSLGNTMGFTGLDGLPMGSRCGQIDPGVLIHLMRQHGLSLDQVEDLLYHHSGLKGLSGVSNDMRDLLESDHSDARLAIDYFVDRIGRELGSLAAVLGGLDALVFTAGIGEHAAEIRARVCRNASWLGVALDEEANRRGETRISREGRHPSVWVIPTDEERMIAEHTLRLTRHRAASDRRSARGPR
jgi:acetate kinase